MYNQHADKGKTKHVVHRWRKGFLLLCKERAIADLEDKCWIAVATGNIHMKTSQEQK